MFWYVERMLRLFLLRMWDIDIKAIEYVNVVDSVVEPKFLESLYMKTSVRDVVV